MESLWTIWETDFHSDNFVNQLNSGDSLYSIDDPIPTNCSFGRKKRREDMTIPQLPKNFIIPPKNNSGMGRGLSKPLATVESIPKPGQLSFQSSQEVSHEVLHENKTKSLRPLCRTSSEKPQNLRSHQKKESLIFDQNSFHSLNFTHIDKPDLNDKSEELNILDDTDFPELISSNGSENKNTKRFRKSRSSKK